MGSRSLTWLGMIVGSTLGGLIPSLWGAGMFSPWSILSSGIGALIGLWAGFKLGEL